MFPPFRLKFLTSMVMGVLTLTFPLGAAHGVDYDDLQGNSVPKYTKKPEHPHLEGVLEDSLAPSIGHGIDEWEYMPFAEGNRLVTPAHPPSLRIRSNHPVLDGAIAMLPIYAAIVQATYDLDPGTHVYDVLDWSNTSMAYTLLSEGRIDMFFGLEPSLAQRTYARSRGRELVVTPIAREAFVFFVNKDNPLTGLSLEHIRQIYSKRIRNWQAVGGPDAPILAFQRPGNSGSQTIMEQFVMEDTPLAAPPREELMMGMGDIIMEAAAYRNRFNALGYSFRWYATVQYGNPDIRLLAIDGVEPTVENIRNHAYPLTVPVVAVTARPLGQEGPYLGEECQQLLDWVLGPEGQDLIARVGYVPL